MEYSNICIIGNDGRMDYIAEYFYDIGCEICRELAMIDKHSIIILPPPADEGQLNCMKPYIKSGQRIYGGMVLPAFRSYCEGLSIPVIDYLEIDNVTRENAVLTAKGIIREALVAKAVIEESNCLVTGYGFCGKALARELTNHGARVDVMVRNKDSKSDITREGYGFVNMNSYDKVSAEKYSYVFNTVPALIFNSNRLDMFSGNVMFFDIASGPGGIDFGYCKAKGIYAVQSLGIPGREYPVQAGQIIAEAVKNDIT